MSPTEPPRYTLTELAALAGVTPRTVRYYIAQGLLPAAPSAGPGAKYGDAHLARLRLIRRLQRDHQPLAAIRHQVGRLDDAMVLTLDAVPGEAAPAPDSALDYVRRLLSAAPAPQSVAPAPSSGPSAPSMPAPPEPAPMMKQLPSAPAPAMPPPPSAPTLTAPPPAPLQPVRSQWERIVLGPDVELHVRRPLTRSQSKRVDRLIAIGRELLEEDPT